MRKTARQNQSYDEQYTEPEQIEYPKSTVDNPLMEELHTVSSVSAPAWKTPSVVVMDEKKDDPLGGTRSVFSDMDQDLSHDSGRPLAPSTATIISEKEVKDHFHFSDEQLTYTKDMKFHQRLIVTLRLIAVWFSDQYDKYVLFMKNHFPALYEAHDVTKFTIIGFLLFVVLIAAIVIGITIKR